jgi:hypothetical protein
MVTILVAAAAVFAVGAPSASAAQAVALPYCWGATYGGTTGQVCADNDTWINGTVVDPGLRTDCIIKTDTVAMAIAAPVIISPPRPCQIVGTVVTGIDDTGLGQVSYTAPRPSGTSVRMNENDWATLYVDGKAYTVHTEAACVGGGCPTNLAQLLQLIAVQ